MKNKFEIGCEALVSGEWQKARKLLEEALKEEETAEAYEQLAWACWWLNDSSSVFDYRA